MSTGIQVLYNMTALYVAALASDDSFGTPARVQKLDTLKFQFESDTDEIKSTGLISDLLTVATHVTGNIMDAGMNYDAVSIMVGSQFAGSTSGSTPNSVTTIDLSMGGSGLPYFGLIGAFASSNGANVVVGFPKMMLNTVPAFTVEQNQFRRADTPFRAIAPSTTIRKAIRINLNETAADVPTDASGFDTFFSGLFDA